MIWGICMGYPYFRKPPYGRRSEVSMSYDYLICVYIHTMGDSPIWICYVYDGLIYFKHMWDQTWSRMVKMTLFAQTRSIVHALNHNPCLMLLPWLSYRVCVNIFLVLPLYHQLIGVTFVEMWSTYNFPYLDTAPPVACSGFICRNLSRNL